MVYIYKREIHLPYGFSLEFLWYDLIHYLNSNYLLTRIVNRIADVTIPLPKFKQHIQIYLQIVTDRYYFCPLMVEYKILIKHLE